MMFPCIVGDCKSRYYWPQTLRNHVKTAHKHEAPNLILQKYTPSERARLQEVAIWYKQLKEYVKTHPDDDWVASFLAEERQKRQPLTPKKRHHDEDVDDEAETSEPAALARPGDEEEILYHGRVDPLRKEWNQIIAEYVFCFSFGMRTHSHSIFCREGSRQHFWQSFLNRNFVTRYSDADLAGLIREKPVLRPEEVFNQLGKSQKEEEEKEKEEE